MSKLASTLFALRREKKVQSLNVFCYTLYEQYVSLLKGLDDVIRNL